MHALAVPERSCNLLSHPHVTHPCLLVSYMGSRLDLLAWAWAVSRRHDRVAVPYTVICMVKKLCPICLEQYVCIYSH